MDFCEHSICQPVFFIFCVRAKLDTLLEFKEITALCGWIVLGVHMASNFRSSKTHTLTIAQVTQKMMVWEYVSRTCRPRQDGRF